jgi:hypothetical protein
LTLEPETQGLGFGLCFWAAGYFAVRLAARDGRAGSIREKTSLALVDDFAAAVYIHREMAWKAAGPFAEEGGP